VAGLHYFAFGSNLPSARLLERAPSARVLGAARLEGFRLCLDKLASDGSGKVNLARDAAATVWGAVFTLDPGEIGTLDGFEPGYTRISVSVTLEAGGGALEAQTYLSELRSQGLRARAWYRALILAGAREHGLPAAWIEQLELLPAGLR
jgi:gamma-glutamylcyclotransferase (GGCT)/AIG2-like uncharacterized protein YtfP